MALCFGAGFMIIGEALRILGCVCDQFGLYEKLGILIGTQVLGVQEIGGIVIGVYGPYPPKETGRVMVGAITGDATGTTIGTVVVGIVVVVAFGIGATKETFPLTAMYFTKLHFSSNSGAIPVGYGLLVDQKDNIIGWQSVVAFA
jgi:hypothetical protein